MVFEFVWLELNLALICWVKIFSRGHNFRLVAGPAGKCGSCCWMGCSLHLSLRLQKLMPNHATPISYWASGRPLGYLFSWGKFSFLIFSAWQEPCWAHKEAHQLLAQCLDKGITPAGAGELHSCLIYIVIYSAGIPVLPEYKLAFQHVYSHTPTVSSAVTGNYTQKQQTLEWWRMVLVNPQ